MFFYGSSHHEGASAGVVFVTFEEDILPHSFIRIKKYSNNMVEYQVLILGLEMTMDAKNRRIKVLSDSKLINSLASMR